MNVERKVFNFVYYNVMYMRALYTVHCTLVERNWHGTKNRHRVQSSRTTVLKQCEQCDKDCRTDKGY